MSQLVNNSWIGLAQWLAVISMTLDHWARYLHVNQAEYFWLVITLGRWAFPIFAALIAWHALYNSRNLLIYAGRIFILAIISQPLYAWMQQESLFGGGLNICFTLTLGLLITHFMRNELHAYRNKLLALALLILSGFFAPWLDYGFLGVLFIPALALAYQQSLGAQDECLGQQLAAAAAIACAAMIAWWLNSGYLLAQVHSFLALILVLLLPQRISQRFLQPLASLTCARWLWLSWYPLHLLIIASLAHWLA